MVHGTMRAVHAVGKRMARRDDDGHQEEARQGAEGLLGPGRGLIRRPANKCASAIPACMRTISGSSGLNRMARVKCSIAASGSPRATRWKPPRYQAAANWD